MLRNVILSSEEHSDLLRAIDKEMRCLCDHSFITEFRFKGALHHLIKMSERELKTLVCWKIVWKNKKYKVIIQNGFISSVAIYKVS